MATTYNCAIQNLGGQTQSQQSSGYFGVQESGDDILFTFRNLPIGFNTHDAITSGDQVISFLEDTGYSDVSDTRIRFFGSNGDNYFGSWDNITEFADGSFQKGAYNFSWPSGLSSPVSDFYLAPLGRIDIEFTGKFGEEQVFSSKTHTINLSGYENVRLRTGTDVGNFFTSLGFNINSLEDYPATPTIICEEIQDGESTGITTVTFSDQFMTSTVNNTIIQNNTGGVLKEFKTIQDAHAAGTLDVEAANETLTNLYNEL